ncbi:MAG TPA: hypothetical protein VKW77_03965, partial [Acidimicrobiales bacterium]|nr:hypothetical protein [Acidimicrobiales bacterium]
MPKNVPWPPPSPGLAGGHFMRSRGFRSKAVWLLEEEIAALEQFCRDHRRAPPPEAQGLAGRTGMTYQGLMRGVLVTYLKAKGYLARNYRPDSQ